METKFDLHDMVYIGTYERTEEYIDCPDCAGSGSLTVILGSGEQHQLNCNLCNDRHYHVAGKIKQARYKARCVAGFVKGIEIDSVGVVKYRISTDQGHNFYSKEKDGIFYSQEAALGEAKRMEEVANADELARDVQKLKSNRKWSWHVSYYRAQIRDANRTIDHAQHKLGIAKENVGKLKNHKKQGDGKEEKPILNMLEDA